MATYRTGHHVRPAGRTLVTAALRDPSRSDRGLKIGAIPSIYVSNVPEPNCQCHHYDGQCFDQGVDQGTQEHYCNTEYLDEDLNENVDLEGTEYVELPDANLVEDHIEDVNVFPAFSPYDEPRDGQRAYHEFSAELLLNSEECVDVDSTELTEPFLDTKKPEVSCTEMIQQCALFGANINGALNGISCESSTITLIRKNLKPERNKSSRLQSELRQVKEQFRACQRKCQRRLLTIQSLRRKIGGLSDQLKKVRKESQVDRSVLTRLENNPTIQNSLRNSAKKPRGRRYNPELRKFALSSYLCGPRVYRMMRKSRVVCLKIKSGLSYNAKSDKFGPTNSDKQSVL